jgi:hypothetical protein
MLINIYINVVLYVQFYRSYDDFSLKFGPNLLMILYNYLRMMKASFKRYYYQYNFKFTFFYFLH